MNIFLSVKYMYYVYYIVELSYYGVKLFFNKFSPVDREKNVLDLHMGLLL